MTTDGKSEGARLSSAEEGEIFAAPAGDAAAAEQPAPHAKTTTAISSGPFEISPSSFSSPPSAPRLSIPPEAVIENAMRRGAPTTSLAAIVGIGCAVFVVLVGLSLLLFR